MQFMCIQTYYISILHIRLYKYIIDVNSFMLHRYMQYAVYTYQQNKTNIHNHFIQILDISSVKHVHTHVHISLHAGERMKTPGQVKHQRTGVRFSVSCGRFQRFHLYEHNTEQEVFCVKSHEQSNTTRLRYSSNILAEHHPYFSTISCLTYYHPPVGQVAP